jgi:hypothetical protein
LEFSEKLASPDAKSSIKELNSYKCSEIEKNNLGLKYHTWLGRAYTYCYSHIIFTQMFEPRVFFVVKRCVGMILYEMLFRKKAEVDPVLNLDKISSNWNEKLPPIDEDWGGKIFRKCLKS